MKHKVKCRPLLSAAWGGPPPSPPPCYATACLNSNIHRPDTLKQYPGDK